MDFKNQAIAELPLNPSRAIAIKEAIRTEKSLQLIESDFEGINV